MAKPVSVCIAAYVTSPLTEAAQQHGQILVIIKKPELTRPRKTWQQLCILHRDSLCIALTSSLLKDTASCSHSHSVGVEWHHHSAHKGVHAHLPQLTGRVPGRHAVPTQWVPHAQLGNIKRPQRCCCSSRCLRCRVECCPLLLYLRCCSSLLEPLTQLLLPLQLLLRIYCGSGCCRWVS